MTIFRASRTRSALLCACALLPSAGASSPHAPRRHSRHAAALPSIVLDLSPVAVLPRVLPVPSTPAQALYLKRMNLENGVEVRGVRGIPEADVTSRNLFVLSVTQSLEGGYDTVNLYDKGVLSWGLMQWTAGTGSLPPALTYLKRRLIGTGQRRVWDKVFAAQGIDADAAGLIVYGKPLVTSDDMRRAFRGSALPGNYDPKVAGYWATVFARAGRQPAVQKFQGEYAAQSVDKVLGQPFQKTTLAGLCGRDPYAEALLFALWTNNPRHALEYAAEAAQIARRTTGEADPALWGPTAFRAALLARCRTSRFGNWRERAALISQKAEALHSAPPSALSPFERVCQAALSARKAQLAARLKSRGAKKPLRPLLSRR